MKRMIEVSLLLFALALTACASTFVSTWKSPDAAPLQLKGEKVAAAVMMKNADSRRAAEDVLAKEITAHGAQGIALYTIVPNPDPSDTGATRAALEKAGVQGLVVMRPTNVDNKVTAKSKTYLDPNYRDPGGYSEFVTGPSWAQPVSIGNEYHTETVVSVETRVYSLKQNKLVWTGQSKTTNPANTGALVKELSTAAAEELQRIGLISR